MSELTRFKMDISYPSADKPAFVRHIATKHGDWVRYADADQRIKELQREYNKLLKRDTSNLKRLVAAQAQLEQIDEACRELRDDWAPEHPPYAAQELIERIEAIREGKETGE